jgi:hypothetical protein
MQQEVIDYYQRFYNINLSASDAQLILTHQPPAGYQAQE